MRRTFPAYSLLVCLSLLIYSSILFVEIHGRTDRDDQKRYEAGQPKVVQGILEGDFQLFREGVAGGGSMMDLLEPFLGELVLQVGKAYVDFPVCPPLHLAVNLGTSDQLSIADYLLRSLGYNADGYKLPPTEFYDPMNRGYPPALFYGIGLGQRPNNTHAGFLLRLLKTHPNLFNSNTSIVQDFLQDSGNPPLLHMTISLQNFDGTYILVSEFNQSLIHEKDDHHLLTPLHLASWYQDIQTSIFLLHNGADVYALDRFHRLPFHLSLFRHDLSLFYIFLNYILENKISNHDQSTEKLLIFQNLLFLKDKNGEDSFDYLMKSPIFYQGIEGIMKICNELVLERGRDEKCPIEDWLLAEEKSEFSSSDNIKTSSRSTKWKKVVSNYSDNAFSSSLPPISLKMNDDSLWEYHSKEHPLFTIDKITKQQNFSRLIFQRNYYSLQRPVLIQHQLTRKFGIWAYLTSIVDFLERYGSLSIETNQEVYRPYYLQMLCYPPIDLGYHALRNSPQGDNDIIWKEYTKHCLHPPNYQFDLMNNKTTNSGKNKKKQATDDSSSPFTGNRKIILNPKITASGERISETPRRTFTIEDFFLKSDRPITMEGESFSQSSFSSSSSSSFSTKGREEDRFWIAQSRISFTEYYQHFYQDFFRPPSFQLCTSNYSSSSLSPSLINAASSSSSSSYFKKDYEDFKITLSTTSSISSFHAHNHSYNLLLHGKKKWYLFPPSIMMNQSLWTEFEMTMNITKLQFLSEFAWKQQKQQQKQFDSITNTRSSILFLFQQILSFFRHNNVGVYEIIQEPEEILFIPTDWPHIVISLEDSISLSQEFCTFLSTDLRVQPLGWILYGGKDNSRGLGHWNSHIRTNKIPLKKAKRLEKHKTKVSFDLPYVT